MSLSVFEKEYDYYSFVAIILFLISPCTHWCKLTRCSELLPLNEEKAGQDWVDICHVFKHTISKQDMEKQKFSMDKIIHRLYRSTSKSLFLFTTVPSNISLLFSSFCSAIPPAEDSCYHSSLFSCYSSSFFFLRPLFRLFFLTFPLLLQLFLFFVLPPLFILLFLLLPAPSSPVLLPSFLSTSFFFSCPPIHFSPVVLLPFPLSSPPLFPHLFFLRYLPFILLLLLLVLFLLSLSLPRHLWLPTSFLLMEFMCIWKMYFFEITL